MAAEPPETPQTPVGSSRRSRSRSSTPYVTPVNARASQSPLVGVNVQLKQTTGVSSNLLAGLQGGEYQLKLCMYLAVFQVAKIKAAIIDVPDDAPNKQVLIDQIVTENGFVVDKEACGLGAIDDVLMSYNNGTVLCFQNKHQGTDSQDDAFGEAFFMSEAAKGKPELPKYVESWIDISQDPRWQGRNLWTIFYTNKRRADTLPEHQVVVRDIPSGFEQAAKDLPNLLGQDRKLKNSYLFKYDSKKMRRVLKKKGIKDNKTIKSFCEKFITCFNQPSEEDYEQLIINCINDIYKFEGHALYHTLYHKMLRWFYQPKANPLGVEEILDLLDTAASNQNTTYLLGGSYREIDRLLSLSLFFNSSHLGARKEINKYLGEKNQNTCLLFRGDPGTAGKYVVVDELCNILPTGSWIYCDALFNQFDILQDNLINIKVIVLDSILLSSVDLEQIKALIAKIQEEEEIIKLIILNETANEDSEQELTGLGIKVNVRCELKLYNDADECALEDVLDDDEVYFNYGPSQVAKSAVLGKSECGLYRAMQHPLFLMEIFKTATDQSITYDPGVFEPCIVKAHPPIYMLRQFLTETAHVNVYLYFDSEMIDPKALVEAVDENYSYEAESLSECNVILFKPIERDPNQQLETIALNYLYQDEDSHHLVCLRDQGESSIISQLEINPVSFEQDEQSSVNRPEGFPGLLINYGIQNCTVLSAQAGFGKSEQMQQWCARLNASPNYCNVAIYLPLRKLKFLPKSHQELVNFFLEKTGYSIDCPMWLRWAAELDLNDGLNTVFADGLDEVHPSHLESVNGLLELFHPCNLVLAGRPAFLQQINLSPTALLGLEPFGPKQLNTFLIRYLQKADKGFSDELIVKFTKEICDRYFPDTAADRYEGQGVDNHGSLLSIFQSPLLANFLAQLCVNNCEDYQAKGGNIQTYLPWQPEVTKAQIFLDIIKHQIYASLGKRLTKRVVDPVEGMEEEDLRLRQEFEHVLLRLAIIAFNCQFSVTLPMLPGFGKINPHLIECLTGLVECSRDDDGKPIYDFIIKSIQEFLSAWLILYAYFKVAPNVPLARMISNLVRHNYFTVQYKEVFGFVTDLLNSGLIDALGIKLQHTESQSITLWPNESNMLNAEQIFSRWIEHADIVGGTNQAIVSFGDTHRKLSLYNWFRQKASVTKQYITYEQMLSEIYQNTPFEHCETFAQYTQRLTDDFTTIQNFIGGVGAIPYKNVNDCFEAASYLCQLPTELLQQQQDQLMPDDYDGALDTKAKPTEKIKWLANIIKHFTQYIINNEGGGVIDKFQALLQLEFNRTRSGRCRADISHLKLSICFLLLKDEGLSVAILDNHQMVNEILTLAIDKLTQPFSKKVIARIYEGSPMQQRTSICAQLRKLIAHLQSGYINNQEKIKIAIELLTKFDAMVSALPNLLKLTADKFERTDHLLADINAICFRKDTMFFDVRQIKMLNNGCYLLAQYLGVNLCREVTGLCLRPILHRSVCFHTRTKLATIFKSLKPYPSIYELSKANLTGEALICFVILAATVLHFSFVDYEACPLPNNVFPNFAQNLIHKAWQCVQEQPRYAWVGVNLISILAWLTKSRVYYEDQTIIFQYPDLTVEPIISPELTERQMARVLQRFCYLKDRLGYENCFAKIAWNTNDELAWARQNSIGPIIDATQDGIILNEHESFRHYQPSTGPVKHNLSQQFTPDGSSIADLKAQYSSDAGLSITTPSGKEVRQQTPDDSVEIVVPEHNVLETSQQTLALPLTDFFSQRARPKHKHIQAGESAIPAMKQQR